MRGMLPSFESQKMVTEKTTKGEAQAYSPLETPFVYAPRAQCAQRRKERYYITVGAIINRPCLKYKKAQTDFTCLCFIYNRNYYN